ncbi:MAG: antibiotic biosynthesis monooxygenase [Epsilonproteobacteria bacterium]|nr:antibiotic biosynthesis monooxygenase [Campylobacterota bacterium]|tara:strand:- start:1895 stop:2269 length:375 start_codon:yes stop_codon:yes gene_type:complete
MIKKISLLTLFFTLILSENSINTKDTMTHNHYVIVTLTAKPGKEQELKEALLKVRNLSREENTNISYDVHEDINNPAQFVLYESWTSKQDHEKQFTKPYIQDLGKQLEILLDKPFQHYMAQRID